MPRHKNKVPSLLRNQSASDKAEGLPGRAFCVVNGRSYYFGRYGSEEADAAYHTFIAEYIAAGYRVPTPVEEVTIAELCAAYWIHARAYYNSEGEKFMIQGALKSLDDQYGHEPVVKFSPLKVEVLLNKSIESGLSRTGVNHRLNRIKRLFKWGIAKDMVPADLYIRVQAVPGLRRGRSAAKEGRFVSTTEGRRFHGDS
ncbi:MAG: hypothetical protein AMXMBFR84_49970 [Candidatus Hydrogenedentota bacterium]